MATRLARVKLEMVKDGHLGGYIRGGDPATWCPALWQWAVARFDAGSVLDVGCGEGHAVRHFVERVGCEALGLDGCRQALRDGVAPGRVCLHDFCDGPFVPQRPYDLVWSCEFLEHVAERFVPHVLTTFAAAARAILVTHAFPGQEGGYHHVNCRPSAYWIRRIESLGFRCDVALTLRSRKVTLADYFRVNHYARSGLLFVRREGTSPVYAPGDRSTTEPPWAWSQRQLEAVPAWRAAWKERRIRLGFQSSPAYWRHRVRRRLAKLTGRAA